MPLLQRTFTRFGDASSGAREHSDHRDQIAMKKIAAVAMVLAASPAMASVPTDIHERCLKATDYIGCVKAQQGITEQTSRVINQQGADVAEGNSCPSGYAYAGGGNCKKVICSDKHLTHNGVLIDAGWQKCPKVLFVF